MEAQAFNVFAFVSFVGGFLIGLLIGLYSKDETIK